MALRLVLAVSCSAALCLAASAQPAGVILALRLQLGDRIVQHTDLVDRVEWVLPPSRLAAFAAQGAIINEEVRTSILSRGSVVSASSGVAKIVGTISSTVRDVPRKHTTSSHVAGASLVTQRNVDSGVTAYPLESAAMVGLPPNELHVGTHWTTRQHVVTTLGSGEASFEHTVAAIEGSQVRVDVTGSGTITGREYNLPHLLPGTIALNGSAWFDLASGLIAQESYRIENRLVKPAGSDRIGFIERMMWSRTCTKKDAPQAA
jgi:hypothetical protein